jgi:hypothetical protein
VNVRNRARLVIVRTCLSLSSTISQRINQLFEKVHLDMGTRARASSSFRIKQRGAVISDRACPQSAWALDMDEVGTSIGSMTRCIMSWRGCMGAYSAVAAGRAPRSDETKEAMRHGDCIGCAARAARAKLTSHSVAFLLKKARTAWPRYSGAAWCR